MRRASLNVPIWWRSKPWEIGCLRQVGRSLRDRMPRLGDTRQREDHADAERLVQLLRPASHAAIWSLLLVLALSVSRCPAQDKQPGELLPLMIPGTQVKIRFRWCPPGEVRPGDPDENEPRVVIDRGFYLSETEITQGQFKAVLGQEALDCVRRRVTANPNLPYSEFLTDDYPVFMVTVSEAAKFCATLQNELADEVSGLEFVQVRIPVNFEWQYACLAREQPDPDAPHFSEWPSEWKDIPVEAQEGKGRTTLEKYLEENKLSDGFAGTQGDVVTLLRNSDSLVNLKVLEAFMRRAVDLDHELGVNEFTGILKKSYDGVDPTGKANKWQLHHMHTNAYEWTWISSRGQELVNDEWNLLKGEDAAQLRNRNVKVGRLGAGFATRREWESFLAWHVVEYPYPATVKEQEDGAITAQAGIRVLYRTSPAPTWLVQVRSKALTGDETTLQQARDKVLPKMSQADAHTNRARIDFYSALAKYRSGDKQAALVAFQQAKPTIAASDPFFEQYGELLRWDSSAP